MKFSKIIATAIILTGVAALFFLSSAPPIARLVAASLGMIWMIKVAALIWQTGTGIQMRSRLGLFSFLFLWPGTSVNGFTERGAVPLAAGDRFLESWLTFLLGIAILIGASVLGRGESTLANYAALVSVLMIVHLGLIEVIADGLRLLGFSPHSLFDRPFSSVSLRDFWSIRWNRAFVDMNKIFLVAPLKGKISPALLTSSVFALSGALHEMAISYADSVSWGSPLLYFVIQGAGMQIERWRKLPKWFVWCWLLFPSPLLFTPAFTNLFLGDLCLTISNFVLSIEASHIYQYGLILGGAFHLLVLCASVQVPSRLGWREEFQKLSSLNRKVFWTYGAYILSIIVFMSATSFVLSTQSLQNSAIASFLWLLFMALFWWARVVIDLFYMSHSDWPQGPLFSIGHVCLTTLFISISSLYTVLAFLVFGAMK